MRRWAELALAGLGATTIYNLWMVAVLISDIHDRVYHWSGTAWSLFFPTIRDFCAFWLLLTLLLKWTDKSGRRCVAVWSGIALFSPWILLKNWILLSGKNIPHWTTFTLFVVCLIAFLAVLTGWNYSYQSNFARVQRFLNSVLSSVGLIGAIALCQLVWLGWQGRSLNVQLPLHRKQISGSAQTSKPRFVWILLDELSYEQVYERRFRGLKLPAFDQLATESTLFTQVVPAGIMTEIVLPSLITGQEVDDVRFSADGRSLSMNDSKTKKWQLFDQHDTVFQDALNAGYTTAIAGWYNPYCRILPEVLDSCFWDFQAGDFNEPYLAGPTGPIFLKLLNIPKIREHIAALRIMDYRNISEAADQMLEDSSDNFLFIHMPIPHPGGIYDRTTDKFVTKGSSYLSNLVLADKYLAHVRSILEHKGEWDSSTIVVMGDHSWRTKLLWASETDWTQEEQIASNGGQFDDRPAYIVKLPNQHVGTRIDTSFAATNTRNLFDELIAKKIQVPEELSAWVAANGKVHLPRHP